MSLGSICDGHAFRALQLPSYYEVVEGYKTPFQNPLD